MHALRGLLSPSLTLRAILGLQTPLPSCRLSPCRYLSRLSGSRVPTEAKHDHLHVLANYEWDSRPLLSLVLVGLPELNDRMRLHRNRSLWSRIHSRLALGEAAPEDTICGPRGSRNALHWIRPSLA